jgi:hypothetical protein
VNRGERCRVRDSAGRRPRGRPRFTGVFALSAALAWRQYGFVARHRPLAAEKFAAAQQI